MIGALKQKMKSFAEQAGYTLVTTSIVIMAIGMLVVVLVKMNDIYQNKAQTIESDQQMTNIRKALDQFVEINGRLPCPAPLAAEQDTEFFAKEIAGCDAAAYANMGLITNVTGSDVGAINRNVRIGAIPTRTLGLPDSAGIDGFGKRVVYAVTADYTVEGVNFNDNHGAISLLDDEGDSVTANGNAVYIILSPGMDNRGAYGLSGQLLEACEPGNFASENCDFDDAVFNVSMNRSYQNNADTYTNTFYYEASLDAYRWRVVYTGACICPTKTRLPSYICVDLKDVTVADNLCRSAQPAAPDQDCSSEPTVDNCFAWDYPTTSARCASRGCGSSSYTATGTVSSQCMGGNSNGGPFSIESEDEACLREGKAENPPAAPTRRCTYPACAPPPSSSYGSGGGGGSSYQGANGQTYGSREAARASGGTGHPTSGDPTQPSGSSGSSSGGSSGGRVICTHFYRKKRLPSDLYFADMEYTMRHIHPVVVRGYHAWAIPVVRMLRENDQGWLGKLMWFITINRAEELGYQMGIRSKPNYIGKLLRWTIEPASYVVGLFFDPQDYRTLYKNGEMKTFAKEFRAYKKSMATA